MRADDLLRAETGPYRDTVLVSLVGELDMATGPLVTDAVSRALAAGPSRLDLDVSALTFCDASGLRALLQARRASGLRHVEFRLVGVRPGLRRVLALLRATDLLLPEPAPAPVGNRTGVASPEHLRPAAPPSRLPLPVRRFPPKESLS
ncbi:STAS domain-containing protein [Kitasatospora sp. NPDC101235]|uniref:STAS domain-containing protein n=1 Tax=Kitasatospora sp. NPDC101235 TaxID=3364101 RepID=UPI00382500F3